jgi:hypothetical protein
MTGEHPSLMSNFFHIVSKIIKMCEQFRFDLANVCEGMRILILLLIVFASVRDINGREGKQSSSAREHRLVNLAS